MLDLRIAMKTNLLLVDDNFDQLKLRAMALEMSGFTVVTASGPVEAISIMAGLHEIDVAILDYHMPVMNGCVLADYLKSRYSDLKIILYSADVDIGESEMTGVDVFISKAEGLAPLLAQVFELAKVHGSVQGALFAPGSYFGSEPEWLAA